MKAFSQSTSTVFLSLTSFLIFSFGYDFPQAFAAGVNRKKPELLPPDSKAIVPPTPEDRLDMIGRSLVWIGQESKRTVLEGPLQKKKEKRFSFNETIKCRFKRPDEIERPGGKTSKFICDLNGEELKVKYQTKSEFNPGVWGEILSTRLFWALGFPADAVYPVKVLCEGCPKKPWKYYQGYYEINDLLEFEKNLAETGESLNEKNTKRLVDLRASLPQMDQEKGELLIEDALVEFKFKSPKIETHHNQGWNWDEFEKISDSATDPKIKREIRIQRDALALLASFVQHADNKAEQQRIVCMDLDSKDGRGQTHCDRPLLMVQDLGFTFGDGWIMEGEDPKFPGRMLGKGTTADLPAFRKAPLWSNPEACVTQINYFVPTGHTANKQVSEEGRQFLVELFNQFLKNEQNVRDLFIAARIERNLIKDKTTGKLQSYGVEEWVDAFKERVEKIKNHRCPLLDK